VIRAFFRSESAAGFLLMAAAVLGFVLANSPAHDPYEQLLGAKLHLPFDLHVAHLSVHHLINDGLMAVFFLFVGLEIKREILIGELSSPARAALPAIAAVGGMLLPALICAGFVWNDPARLAGWAIPAATDISFALAVLTLLGRSVPSTLKVFLTALAVIDDLGAILIIAFFYTESLHVQALLLGVAAIAVLVVMNRLRVLNLIPYLVVGAFLWVCFVESGVHATIAGVALSLTIPLRGREDGDSPLKDLEHGLMPFVSYAILPIFGFANAGVSVAGISPAVLAGPLPLGIALGLFAGKQLGIFSFAWLAIRSGVARLPKGATLPMLYGVSLLGGIGFTMSLFIGTLAFDDDALLTEMKIGVFAGSILSALIGYVVLKRACRPQTATES
jgi:NhaA family Na+:H+ antiporter